MWCGDRSHLKTIIDHLPDEVATITLLADVEQKELAAFGLPIVYVREGQANLVGKLHTVLNQLEPRRTLVISGTDDRLTTDHISQLMDYSERLPHMSVVATLNGRPLLLPLVIPSRAVEDIGHFLKSGGSELSAWLQESVFIECELSGTPSLL